MDTSRPILAAALLVAVTAQAQAVPITVDSSSGSRNLSSEGTTFVYALPLNWAGNGELVHLLLSLSFNVSQNAAAQNDTISLFAGDVLLASGQAAGFSVTDLDVTDFFDFMTDTFTYELFRGVLLGGGNIKLDSSTLRLVSTSGVPGDGFTSEPQGDVARPIPEPGALTLLGFGLLSLVALRRLRMNRQPAWTGHSFAESRGGRLSAPVRSAPHRIDGSGDPLRYDIPAGDRVALIRHCARSSDRASISGALGKDVKASRAKSPSEHVAITIAVCGG